MEIIPLPAFDDNYIWVVCNAQQQIAIIDPGDAEPVLTAIDQHGWQPSAILLTHHHYDHTGGVAELAERYQLPIYGPASESIPLVTHPLVEGETLDAAGLQLTVMETPGHTRGSICYLGDGVLFCGDTLFTGGCGRIFEGTPTQMFHSLERIRSLPPETLVYCAHEYTQANLRFARIAEPDNQQLQQRIQTVDTLRGHNLPTVPAPLQLELETNPFLRSHLPWVKSAAEHYAHTPLTGPAQVFTCVRNWKDALD